MNDVIVFSTKVDNQLGYVDFLSQINDSTLSRHVVIKDIEIYPTGETYSLDVAQDFNTIEDAIKFLDGNNRYDMDIIKVNTRIPQLIQKYDSASFSYHVNDGVVLTQCYKQNYDYAVGILDFLKKNKIR